MKFSLEFRLNISNRSSHAVRDLAITSTLASARRDSGIAMPNGEQPVQLVERIGPHQSRSVTGMLEVPWKEVHALRQGQTPLFVPLLLVTIEASGLPKHTRSFVIGTPSAASQAKLHPIPLDTPPGGVSGLRAREVKQVEAKQPA